MGRVRVGAFAGVLALGATIAFGATNCAAPTQIIIDVRAERALCDTNRGAGKFIVNTGIAVTTPERIDDADLTIFEGSGCDDPGDQIGTLTITPRADRDAEVGVRIVSGVGKKAEQCEKPFDGCIVARRVVRFVPNQTVNITVIMGELCLGKDCKDGTECNPKTGECVLPAQVQDDGAVTPLPEGGKDSQSNDGPPPNETGTPDTGLDACAACNPPGTCVGTTCTVNCTGNNCMNRTVCEPGVNCFVACNENDACRGTRCLVGPNNTCEFTCGGPVSGGGGQTRCDGIICSGSTCKLTCKDVDRACDNIIVDAGINNVTCELGKQNPATDVTCDDLGCHGNICNRTCGDDASTACSKTPLCTTPPAGNCNNWAVGDGGN